MNNQASIFLSKHLSTIINGANACALMCDIHGADGSESIGMFKQIFQKIGFASIDGVESPEMVECIFDIDFSLDEENSNLVDEFEYESKERLVVAIKNDMSENMGWVYDETSINAGIDILLNVCLAYDNRNGTKLTGEICQAITDYSFLIQGLSCRMGESARQTHEAIRSHITEFMSATL